MSNNQLIYGLEIKSLKSFPDERGFFREIIRITDDFFDKNSFAQWSHSNMGKDVVKAWHYHHLQTDWWYLGNGVVQAVFFDYREESPSYLKKNIVTMGDSSLGLDAKEVCVKIPPGVLHGLKVLTESADIFYVTSRTYDPNDEGRIPYNSKLVPHNWGENIIVTANDCKEFVPTNKRISCV